MFAPRMAKFSQCWLTLGQFSTNIGQCLPMFETHWPTCGRFGPAFRRNLANMAPTLAQLGQNSPEAGPISVTGAIDRQLLGNLWTSSEVTFRGHNWHLRGRRHHNMCLCTFSKIARRSALLEQVCAQGVADSGPEQGGQGASRCVPSAPACACRQARPRARARGGGFVRPSVPALAWQQHAEVAMHMRRLPTLCVWLQV